MAKPKGSLHRLIDQSSLGSADSLASLSKTEEETCAQDELWADMSPPLNRYPSYTDIQVTPSPGQQTVALSSPQGEGAADEAMKPPNGNQSHSNAPPAHSFAEQRTINVRRQDHAEHRRPQFAPDFGMVETPAAPRTIFPGGDAFAALETVARLLQDASEKQARAEEEVNEWREKFERERQRAVAAEGRVTKLHAQLLDGDSPRFESSNGPNEAPGARPLTAVTDPRMAPGTSDREPGSQPSTARGDGRMAPGGPCSCSYEMDICGRRVLRSGIPGEKDRGSNGEANDGRHGPGASWRDAGDSWRGIPGEKDRASNGEANDGRHGPDASWCDAGDSWRGIPGEKDRASNGEANDGRHGPDASWRDARDSWRIADGGTRKAEGKEDGEKRGGMRCPPRKAHFKLAWRSADGVETTHRHRHEIVSYERGNISNMARSNKQVALVWETPPQAVLIVRKPNSSRVSKMVQEVVRWLTNVKKLTVVLEPASYRELIEGGGSGLRVETWEEEEELLCMHQRVDLVVTLGGDGTVLWASSLFKGPVPPVVSFAMGSLGFLTPFPIEGYQDCLSSLLKGPIYLTLRNRIQCRIIENGADQAIISPRPTPAFERLVLNEVAIDRGMSSFLTNLECYCDGDSMTTVQGDGLIVSTPSGSTAYSLSAGGSMVHPQVPGILFTPICPHSLSFRPLILPEYVCLRVQVPFETRGQAWASFDGRDRRQLCPGDALILEMSHWPVPAACHEDATQDFLNSARENLHWNLRKLQE